MNKRLTLPVLLIFAAITLSGCSEPQHWTVKAQAAAGLDSPFTEHCQTITSPHFSGTLSAKLNIMETSASPTAKTFTFDCHDKDGKVSGTTTITTTNMKLTASSSEGSSDADSYAKTPGILTTGIYPIIK